jgi:hypothetical protein
MKIDTSASFIKEAVFPKHTFSGSIELEAVHIKSIVDEIQSMKLYNYNWGKSAWNSDPNETWNITDKISKVVPLINKQLFDIVTNHYGYKTVQNNFIVDNNKFFLECRRCFPVILYPGHDFPLQHTMGYFSCITMLSCSGKSHKPYIQNMDSSPYADDKIRFWYPKEKQQIFIPGGTPWGISCGSDETYTIALVSHILRKRPRS